MLEPAWLAARLEGLRPAGARGGVLVACSGGLDSSVLLDACIKAGVPRLAAAYVDHGLHPDAAGWGDCVASACEQGGVPLHRLRVRLDQGGNLEARARSARYSALAQRLGHGDLLLSAHHADDQLETMLLQLFRGAGPAGLAAMPACRALGAGWHLRPLLELPRASLLAYADAHAVRYQDDPSNLDLRFERNFLRAEVLPLLKARWPGVLATAARSAALCAQSQALGTDLAQLDGAAGDGPLRLDALLELPPRRLANAMRTWLQAQGVPSPNQARLDEFVRQLREASSDRHPQLRYAGHGLRRYRNWLFLLPADPPPPADWSAELQPGGSVALPGALGVLALHAAAAGSGSVTVRFRHGGESLRLRDDGPHVTLKSLFQQRGVLPWWRDRVPLLWSGERLMAVGDLWFAPAWAADRAAAPAAVRWRDRPSLFPPATS